MSRNGKISGVFAMTLVVAAAGGAAQTTRLVPAQHPTIQAAVDAAQSGDTILVSAGTYGEVDFLGKTLDLRSAAGAGATTIQASSRRITAITMIRGERSGTRVSGFTILGRGASQNEPNAGGGIRLSSMWSVDFDA